MTIDPTSEADALDAFLLELWRDYDQRSLQSLGHYVDRFPELGSRVHREYEACQAANNRPTPLLPTQKFERGATFGRYTDLQHMGFGGQGHVYRAWDPNLGCHVALKLLLNSTSRHPGRNREATLVSTLKHPSICTVYDAGVRDGISYISMEFVEGETLAAQLARRRHGVMPDTTFDALQSTGGETTIPLPSSEKRFAAGSDTGEEAPTSLTREELVQTLELFEDVARAIHAAHEAGIIHRDIKPGNIMVRPDGSPVVLDFGLARPLPTADADVAIDSIPDGGTLHYMSPEQIRGAPLGRETDVWSLAVALFESVTLRRPFLRHTIAGLKKAIEDEPLPNPCSINPHIPRPLALVLKTALEKEPQLRYRTAADLAEDLRRIRHREPPLVQPLRPWTRVRLWTRRHPTRAVAVASLLLVATSMTISSIANRRLSDSNRQLYHRAEQGRRTLMANQELDANPKRALQIALAAAEYGMNPALRSVMIRGLSTHTETRSWTSVRKARVSPEGKALLRETYDGAIEVVSLPDGALQGRWRLRPGEYLLTVSAIGPEGRCAFLALEAKDATLRTLWWIVGQEPMPFHGHNLTMSEAPNPATAYRMNRDLGNVVNRLLLTHSESRFWTSGREAWSSPEGKALLLKTCDNALEVVSLPDGSPLGRWLLGVGEDLLPISAIGPEGRCAILVLKDKDDTVRTLWWTVGKEPIPLHDLDGVQQIRFVAADQARIRSDGRIFEVGEPPAPPVHLKCSMLCAHDTPCIGPCGPSASAGPSLPTDPFHQSRNEDVYATVLAQSGELTVIGGRDGVRIRKPGGTEETLPLDEPTGGVTAVAVAQNGHLVYGGFEDGRLARWHVGSSGPPVITRAHQGKIMWLGSVAQGQVASLGEDDVLRLWGHEHPLEGRPPAGIGWTLHPACHPSGTRAARWDANDAQPDTWAEPDASFWVDLAIALGPNPPWSYVGHSRWPVFFSPEGDLVGFRRGPLTVTDVHTDQLIATLSGWTVCGLAFIPGQRALLRDFDETDLVTGHSSRLMPLERTRSIPAVSSDGRYVAYVVTEQPALAIFDLRTGQQVATLRTPGTTSLVMSIAWSGDGRIACGDLSGTIWVWSGPFDGARPRRFAGHRRHVDRIHLTGDGSWMVSAADDGTARVWDLRAGAEWMTIPARDGPFRGAATDPETATVWTWAANGRVQGWPLHPEKVLRARGIEPLSARELERLTAP